MLIRTWTIAGALAATASTSASARELTIKVDARAMPWRSGANPKLAYGLGDGRAPAMVVGFRLISGTKVRFTATGGTNTIFGGETFGPEGQSGFITNGTRSGSAVFFPSRYISPAQYPIRLNQLVGAFIDADGKVVGAPFAVGRAADIVVPEGGVMAISLGINDDKFSDNSGALQVVVEYNEGSVSVE